MSAVSLIDGHEPSPAGLQPGSLAITRPPALRLPADVPVQWWAVTRCESGTGGLCRFLLAGCGGGETIGPVFFGRAGRLDDLLAEAGLSAPERVRFVGIQRSPTTPAGRVVALA